MVVVGGLRGDQTATDSQESRLLDSGGVWTNKGTYPMDGPLATGRLNGSNIVCGGGKSCFHLETSSTPSSIKWKKFADLKQGRRFHSMVAIQNPNRYLEQV